MAKIVFIICALSSILPNCISSPMQLPPTELNTNNNAVKSSPTTDTDASQIITTTPTSTKCTSTLTEYKGKCFQVLQQLPCPDGEWLVELEDGKEGTCVENKCAQYGNVGYFKGQCVQIRSEEYCPKGMRTYIYKSGIVACDCKEGHIYNPLDGICYEAYRQGPCKEGMIFVSTTDASNTSKTLCRKNPCKTEGYYCYGGTDSKCERKGFFWMWFPFSNKMSSNCMQFGSPCTPDCKGIFVIHPDTNMPYCQQDLHDITIGRPNTRIIGNVPIFKCAPGSRRDILGNCRTPTTIDFS